MKEIYPMKNLAKIRKEKGFTQQQLSKACGFQKETISRYERGVRQPSVNVLRKISEILSCAVSDLI